MADVQSVKRAAAGRWPEIISTLGGIPREVLDGRHHPCPRCGGNDRFRLIDEEAGALLCNQCFQNGNGDGISALQWLTGKPFQAVMGDLAGYLGVNGNGSGNGHQKTPTTILEAVAREKGVKPEDFRAYRGKEWGGAVVFPMFGPDGKLCSTFRILPGGDKGRNATRKPAGLFLPGRLPKAGETWLLVEGVKDAAALHGLGYLAAGLPTNRMNEKFAPLFQGVDVVIVPDGDKGGITGAEATAKRLHGIASSVRIARLPTEVKESGGEDVRDILRKFGTEGPAVIQQAIIAAKPTDAGAAPDLAFPDGRTEVANAKRFARKHGNNVRWCEPWNRYLVYGGRHWDTDQQRTADRLAKEVYQDLWIEAAGAAKKAGDSTKDILAFIRQTGTARGIEAMLKLARSEPGIPVSLGDLDRDPWLFNCLNGTLNLRTCELQPHRREDYITKLAKVTYDPFADCPGWIQFIGDVTGGDAWLQEYLQKAAGCSLTGDVREHVLFFLYGTGANGKSTFLNTLQAMMGPDYAMKAPPDMLMAKSSNSHPTERADLAGMRLVNCIEVSEGGRIAESLVKELSGGDKMRVRRMREDYWEFHPTHKIWLAGNHKPTIRGTDIGIWRRIKLIPFTVSIPPERQDKTLPARLAQEHSGILNWCVAGCRKWLEEGLTEPEAIRNATSEYRRQQDVLAGFLDECCIVGASARARAGDLLTAYRKWAGDDRMSQRRLGEALTERGFDTAVVGGYAWRLGVGLRDEHEPLV